MTRKDYELIANALAVTRPSFTDGQKHIQWSMTREMLAIMLREDNERFDKERFREATEA